MTTQMNTGDVSRRLGLPVTAELLESLGFEPVGRDKRAVLWDVNDYPRMCDKLGKWITQRRDVPMQPRPDKPVKAGKPKKSEAEPAEDDEL